VVAVWLLPRSKNVEKKASSVGAVLGMIWRDIDWVGGVLASGGLALLSYVLA
jgi:hypothetical protein